jgi:DNA helicase-2/ATP-dependent DNA helicase PcrA
LTLNPKQKGIVDEPIDATVKTLAGAGTGKTRVLVERYLKFVFEDGISPDNLLALTFTKKAAAEMHGRVFKEVVEREDKDTLRSLYGAWIMNFHQFAFRVIKENAASFGIDPDIGVASEVDRMRIIRGLKRRFKSGTIEGMPDTYAEDIPMPNRMNGYFEKCMKIVDKARGTRWTPQSLLDTIRPGDVDAYKRYVDTVIAVWQAYEASLRSRLLIDFSDMIRIVVEEFSRNERLRRRYSERFVHVLVDEFQDTSESQNRLLELLTGEGFPHVTVVGDEKQSVYRWRDARVDNIREFTGEVRVLSKNYRSKQSILDLAYHVLIEDPYFAKQAQEIHLTADRGQTNAPVCIFHPEDEAGRSPEDEARALGAWILTITGYTPTGVEALEYYDRNSPKLEFGDIAILMRSLKPSYGLPAYEDEFQRLGIPYAILGGVSKLDEQVLDLLKDLLSLLIRPGDVRAFLSVLESMPFELPDQSLYELFRGGARSFDLWGTLSGENLSEVSDPGTRNLLSALRDALEDLSQKRGELDLASFITEALEYTQFFYHMFAGGADLRAIDSVLKRILELVEHLVQRNEANLAAFLEAVEALLERKQFGEDDAPYVPKGRVVIMTQHLAKGLEFPAVAVPALKIPPSPGEGFQLVEGEGLFLSHGEEWSRGIEDTDTADKASADRAQEERCLLYVAMTRAEDHLFVSSPHPDGKEKNRENLFASVLRALAGHDIPHVVWRTTPNIDRPNHIRGAAEPGESTDLADLVDEWEVGHERIEESRAMTRPNPQGLQFVSWRALLAFSSCPLRYYYRYIAGIQDDLLTQRDEIIIDDDSSRRDDGVVPPKGMSAEDFGSFVHRILYEWLSTEDATDESARRVVDGLAGRFGLAGATRKKAVDIAFERVTKFRDTVPWSGEEIYKLERPIQVRVGRLVLHGVVDRVDRTDDGLRVIDYKVGATREDYPYQVQFYSWILNKLSDTPVSEGAVAYLQRESEERSVDVSKEALGVIESTTQQLEEAIDSGQYHAAPGVVCSSCDFRKICRHVAS